MTGETGKNTPRRANPGFCVYKNALGFDEASNSAALDWSL